MSRFKNYVKDLFDLRKPVVTIREKLALATGVFFLNMIYYIVFGIISGFGIFVKYINWNHVIDLTIIIPIKEGVIGFGILWLLTHIIYKYRPKKINLLWVPIFLIAAISGASHANIQTDIVNAVIVKGFSAILLGWLVVKTRSLWPNILVHAIWNGAYLFIFY